MIWPYTATSTSLCFSHTDSCYLPNTKPTSLAVLKQYSRDYCIVFKTLFILWGQPKYLSLPTQTKFPFLCALWIFCWHFYLPHLFLLFYIIVVCMSVLPLDCKPSKWACFFHSIISKEPSWQNLGKLAAILISVSSFLKEEIIISILQILGKFSKVMSMDA